MYSILNSLWNLANPRLIFAILLSTFTSIVIASDGPPNIINTFKIIFIVLLSSVGAKYMNNLLDYSLDIEMKRTSKRKGNIDSVGKVRIWIIAIVISILSIILSYVWFSITVTILVILAILSYALWYTLYLKRKSPFGVILGGIPGSLPILISTYAVSPDQTLSGWLFATIMFFWQPPHFWVLSLKLKNQYANAEIPVFSIIYGKSLTKIFTYLYISVLPPLSWLLGHVNYYTTFYFSTTLLVGLSYLFVTFYLLEKKQQYGYAFMVSILYINLLMLLIWIEEYLF